MNTLEYQSRSFIDPAKLKAELFTLGVRFDEPDRKRLEQQNPFYENRSGLSGGRFVEINTSGVSTVVNLPFFEPFVNTSPYEYKDGILYKNEEPMPIQMTFVSTPNWVSSQLESGKCAGQIIQPHGKGNLATMLFGCDLQTKGRRCTFCTAPRFNEEKIRATQDILESLQYAVSENPNYTLSINTGTLETEGRGLEYTVPLIEAIRNEYPTMGIMAEIAPPETDVWLEKLRDANKNGPFGLMLNVNFWNENTLQKIEPGKNPIIPKSAYKEAWKKSVSLFGKGNVSSCLLAGIEFEDDTRQAIDYLTENGIIPEIILYRPTIGSEPGGNPRDPDLFYRLSMYAKKKMWENKILPAQVGCVNCGGCSLTTIPTGQQ